MSAPIPSSTEPAQFVAGNTVQWYKDLPDYPADQGWTLSYAFVSTSGNKFAVTAAANGTQHSVTIPAATSASYAPGTWYWQSYATSGSTRYDVSSGVTEIRPNFATQSSTYDARTHARRCLDLIKAAMEGRLPDGLDGYNIGGVDIRLISIAQLRDLYNQYRSEVFSEEQAAKGMSTGRNVFVRLSRATS